MKFIIADENYEVENRMEENYKKKIMTKAFSRVKSTNTDKTND